MAGRQRTFLSAFVVGALAVTATLPAIAVADEGTAAWLPEIRASEEISGPDLVRGNFVNRQGQGFDGRLTLIAWPTAKVLSRLADGDHVKTTPVAKAVAGPDGRFVLRMDATVPIKEFMNDAGTVNFDLTGEAANGERAVFSFPRRFDSKTDSWVEPDWLPTQGRGRALDVTLSAHLERVPAEEAEAPVPASDKTHINCGTTVVATYNDRKGIVGEVYTGPHANGDFTYINGSSSTLGVGVSASGSFGTFSASGTSVGSSTVTLGYPLQGINQKKVFQSSWQYKKFRIYKLANEVCVTDYYKVFETAFWGSSYEYTAASAPTATFCASQLNGQELWKDTGTAVTFTNGLDLNVGAVGANLSTRTGFNNATKIYFKFVSAGGQLCGSNTTWPTAARVVGK